jgi:hypothetical protein
VAKSETGDDLHRLEVALKQLEAEYNMFFAGRSRTPPWETRKRVETLVKRYDRAFIQNYGDRFRFQSLRSRFQAFVDLWDKGLRARDEGRPGPFAHHRPVTPPADRRDEKALPDRVVRVESFRDPRQESDKLRTLYESLVETCGELGQATVPYNKFAESVESEVSKLRSKDQCDVAFRISVKDGKVNVTARPLKASR